ncbi:MAG: hydroxyisourate hydrolase [Alphaproteobacteria bacterium]|nr:hydroxyisourate hydrolase [Alphaproteobacteria bacterium]
MGRLTTHVLDTSLGCPGEGIRIELFEISEDTRTKIKEVVTNDDGRCDAPILEGSSLKTGVYELVFHAGEYLEAKGVSLPEPKFLDVIPIRFGIANEDQHYHVPLLISPYSYSTYRGS